MDQPMPMHRSSIRHIPQVWCLAINLAITFTTCVTAIANPQNDPDQNWSSILDALRQQTEAAQPDGPNAWPQLKQIGEKLQSLRREHPDAIFASIFDPNFLWGEDQDDAFDARIRRDTQIVMDEAVAGGLHERVLRVAHERIVLSFERDEVDPFIFVAELGHMREIASFMCAMGYRRLHEGDIQGWFETIDAVLAMSSTVATHPGLLPMLVATSLTDRAENQIQLAIKANRVPKEVLEQLHESLENHRGISIGCALASDRLLMRAMFRQYFDEHGDVKAEVRVEWDDAHHDMSMLFGALRNSADCPGRFRFPNFDTIDGWLAHIYKQIDQMAKLPATTIVLLDPFTDTPECMAFSDIVESIGSAHRQAIIMARRHQAKQRGVVIIIALERFNNANGFYPAALEELAPALLDEIPNDPYTGQSFGYRAIKNDDDAINGYVLYSFGGNGIDNGGNRCEHDTLAWRLDNDEACDVILFERP
jgi:hypothetical protein